MSFTFEKLKIPEVILIRGEVFNDMRGFFEETYKYSEFKDNGIGSPFVQQNHSFSKKGVLRGLHFQTGPKAQGKLVKCVRGEIFDVAADLRAPSPSFLKWVSETLSEDNRKQLYIPPGFAHGFCVLSEEAEVVYSCTNEYEKGNERGIRWDDPALGISWPISNPVLSEKDSAYPFLNIHGKK